MLRNAKYHLCFLFPMATYMTTMCIKPRIYTFQIPIKMQHSHMDQSVPYEQGWDEIQAGYMHSMQSIYFYTES